MYPGTMAIKQAATRPALLSLNSDVSKYVTITVRDEKKGAKKTQIFLMSIVICIKLSM